MISKNIKLKEAIKFHGHLGPYLVIGLLAGELALKKLKCEKYFNLDVKVWGAGSKPKSCLVDGLQLSTGATYGKGNIKKLNGSVIKMEFCDSATRRKVSLGLEERLSAVLEKLRSHRESESFARKIYKTDKTDLFTIITKD